MHRAALFAFLSLVSLLRADEAAAPRIPEWTWEAGTSTSGRAAANKAMDLFAHVAVHRRWAVGEKGWSVGAGISAERYRFGREPVGAPRRLESMAVPLTLEFFQADEAVAGLVIRPGRYVADGASHSSWDAPIDAATGFPIHGEWNGVVGASHGRFYREPLPILGLVWQPRPELRLEAIYPEPAIVWQRRHATVRFGGELIGGGFRCDRARANARSVEFYAYRLGVAFTQERARTRVTWSIGVEPERAFEFDGDRPALRTRGALYLGVNVELRAFPPQLHPADR